MGGKSSPHGLIPICCLQVKAKTVDYDKIEGKESWDWISYFTFNDVIWESIDIDAWNQEYMPTPQ